MKYALAILVALAASVDAQPKPATSQADMDAARGAWTLCVLKEVETLDDGISPASEVATAVQSSCPREYMRTLDTMYLERDARAGMEQSREKTTHDVAVRMVFMVRAKRRGATASAPR